VGSKADKRAKYPNDSEDREETASTSVLPGSCVEGTETASVTDAHYHDRHSDEKQDTTKSGEKQ
jgi:hypothetical protein